MKILVAYDGFDESRPALEAAARLALEQPDPAEIVVVSVVPPPDTVPSPGGPTSMPPHATDDVAAGHAFLRRQGLESEMLILHGDPAAEILREAADRGCDTIVCGTRGLGPLGRLLQGSVSRRVAATAPCPVLIASPGRTERIEPASTGSPSRRF